MSKFIIKIVKRIIMAFLILYGLNMMLTGINFIIPINLITVGTIALLGMPGLMGLVIIIFII